MYICMWEFDVRAGCEAEFERIYGPHGEWVELFRRAPGYRSSRLFRESGYSRRYITVDEWESRAQYDAYRREFAAEYEALDRRCESLTLSELLRISLDAEEVG